MKKISLLITLGCLLGLNMPLSAQSTGTENGHEWVDLGLLSGLKWATCNVGASSPEKSGNYYAWGEIRPKDVYAPENSITYGKDMNDISGNAQYDAATANWGGDWRMPTEEEMRELMNCCTLEWTKQNRIKGYKVTGPNGNSIFLPVTGIFSGNNFYSGTCDLSYYLISTPSGKESYKSFEFKSDYIYLGSSLRCNGYSLRPVKSRVGIETPGVIISEVKCTDVTAIIKTYASDGGAAITERGFYYGTNPEPAETDNKVVIENEVGYISNTLLDLTPNTTYYVKAYATNSEGTSYSEVVSFTTLENPKEYEYVDLGLPSGLKWATHNIGATSPEEYGDYFAWGEVFTKDEYTEANSLTYGKPMDDISGNVQYDAATFNWGGDWRMPTKEEMQELLDNCTWTLTTQNGVYGYKVTSKTNGNSIFLPAAGYRHRALLNHADYEGNYWSSSPQGNYATYCLNFDIGSHPLVNSNNRNNGFSIRPVSE